MTTIEWVFCFLATSLVALGGFRAYWMGNLFSTTMAIIILSVFTYLMITVYRNA